MSSEWKSGKLGDFLELKRGYDLPQAKRESGSVPLVSSSGITDTHCLAKVKGPGVVTGRYGTLGQVFYVTEDFWPLNTTLYVKDFKGNDPRFIHYFLKSMDFLAFSDKAAVPGVNRNHLHEAQVSIAPLKEQTAIAGFLGDLDDRITLLRETNKTLESIAQAIFKSWFVDFDPVRAKMEGRQPEGMDEETAALFPDSFEESELGLVPTGWEAATLGTIANFQNGYAFKSKDWQDDGHPVVKIGDVKPGIIDLSNCSYVCAQTLSGLERFSLNRGDLLVGMTGYVGETGLVPKNSIKPYLNQRVGRISTKNKNSEFSFIYCAVRNSNFKDFAISQSHGSAQANVSGTALLSYPLIMPQVPLLDIFHETVSLFLDKILLNYERSVDLANLRDTLLPRLISGQLRLPEAQEQIEDALS